MAAERDPFLEAEELRSVLACLALATLTLAGIALLFLRDPGLAATLLSSMGLNIIGSRTAAVLVCLARGLSPAWTLLYNLYIEALIVVLCYHAFVLVIREGVESKILRLAAKKAEAAVRQNRGRIKGIELFGLFLFVVAPFPATGPVIAAIAGYLLNLKPRVTFTVVLSATFLALGVYVLLGAEFLRRVIEFRRSYGGAVSAAVAVLAAAFVVLHVRAIARWVRELNEGEG